MKTKPTSQKTAWALATAVALTLAVFTPISAQDRPQVDKPNFNSLPGQDIPEPPKGLNTGPNSEGFNLTEYDRRQQENPIARDKPWRTMNMGEQPVTIGTNRTLGAQDVDASTLTDSWERLNSYQDFTDLRNQVDDHERRLGDLEIRVGTLENVPGNWQPGSPEAGGWQPVGSPGRSLWSPEISNQEADFTQSRTVQQPVQRTVNVYETNAVTGERRLVDTYTETDTQTSTETRLIDVANNPGGGMDGWSAWQNVGSPTGCSTWSPATSTVNQGQTFTQTRNCTQTQRSFIYYLADGDLLETRSRDIGVNAPQSRSAVGTNNPRQCVARTLNFDVANGAWRHAWSDIDKPQQWANFYHNAVQTFGGGARLYINGKQVRWCDAAGEAWPGRGNPNDCPAGAGFSLADSLAQSSPTGEMWRPLTNVGGYRLGFRGKVREGFFGHGSWMFPHHNFWTPGTRVEVCNR